MPRKYHLLVTSPLGQKIHVTKAYWDYIVEKKHPSVSNQEKFVLKTLNAPDTIRSSQKDHTVWLCRVKLSDIFTKLYLL